MLAAVGHVNDLFGSASEPEETSIPGIAGPSLYSRPQEVQYSSKDERLISFHSGTSMSSWGFECNARVEEGTQRGEAILVINVPKNQKQAFAWGGGW